MEMGDENQRRWPLAIVEANVRRQQPEQAFPAAVDTEVDRGRR
jgi:hypothetical protein